MAQTRDERGKVRSSTTVRRGLDLELVSSEPAQLAEGPVWDNWEQSLWWVDIDRHHLWRKRVGDEPVAHDVGQEIAAVVPRRGAGLALVLRRAIVLTDEHLTVTGMIPVPLPVSEAMRLNDAACDPTGRLWFGSMATDGQLDRASLYTLADDHTLNRALGPVSISNGLGWSPDGRTMYYVDTPTRRVDAFPFDPPSGRLGRRRTLASIPASDGKPDGLTVAADGSVWVALWGGVSRPAVYLLGPANGSREPADTQRHKLLFRRHGSRRALHHDGTARPYRRRAAGRADRGLGVRLPTRRPRHACTPLRRLKP